MGVKALLEQTMRSLTNVGLYKIAHSMTVESVETHAEPSSYFKCCNDKKLAIGTEAKCAIEQLRDSSAIPRPQAKNPASPHAGFIFAGLQANN